jgi:tRNA-Thr(GGU) m(6)t(6)A37 methyltransferase TsaA
MDAITLAPVGRVASSRIEPIDDDWGDVEATIELLAPYTAQSLTGLDAFSHVEVVYVFHRVEERSVEPRARRPRGNPDWPEVGIFAQRGKDRPNRIGLCTCEVVAVEGTSLRVRGLDAIDGTPVLDLKPYMREFAPRGEVRQPAWVGELMAGYF